MSCQFVFKCFTYYTILLKYTTINYEQNMKIINYDLRSKIIIDTNLKYEKKEITILTHKFS